MSSSSLTVSNLDFPSRSQGTALEQDRQRLNHPQTTEGARTRRKKREIYLQGVFPSLGQRIFLSLVFLKKIKPLTLICWLQRRAIKISCLVSLGSNGKLYSGFNLKPGYDCTQAGIKFFIKRVVPSYD